MSDVKTKPVVRFEDASLIAKVTGYKIGSVRALLKGKRNRTLKNGKVFKAAELLPIIKKNHINMMVTELKQHLRAQ